MSRPENLDFTGGYGDYNAGRDIVSAARLQNIRKYYPPSTIVINQAALYPAAQTYMKYPKTRFQVGDREVLLDDSVHFFQQMRGQGHDVSLQVIPNLIHCGQMLRQVFQPGCFAIEQAATFIKNGFLENRNEALT